MANRKRKPKSLIEANKPRSLEVQLEELWQLNKTEEQWRKAEERKVLIVVNHYTALRNLARAMMAAFKQMENDGRLKMLECRGVAAMETVLATFEPYIKFDE